MELKRVQLWCLVWPYAARALVQAPSRRRPVGALGASTAKLPPAFTSGSDDRYADWRVDVAAFEASRSAPLLMTLEVFSSRRTRFFSLLSRSSLSRRSVLTRR